MATIRILEAGDPYSAQLENDSGDALLVASTADGKVLISLDDVDDTIVPTARLTPAEAKTLANVLLTAAMRAETAVRRT